MGKAGAGDHTSRSSCEQAAGKPAEGHRNKTSACDPSSAGPSGPLLGNVLVRQSDVSLAARGIMSESGADNPSSMLIARSSARRAISTWAEETRLGRVKTAWHLSEYAALFSGCGQFRGGCRCRIRLP